MAAAGGGGGGGGFRGTCWGWETLGGISDSDWCAFCIYARSLRVNCLYCMCGCPKVEIGVIRETGPAYHPRVWWKDVEPIAYDERANAYLRFAATIPLTSLLDMESSFNCFGYAVGRQMHLQLPTLPSWIPTWTETETWKLLSGTISLPPGKVIGTFSTVDTLSPDGLSGGYRVLFFPPTSDPAWYDGDFHWAREIRISFPKMGKEYDALFWVEKSGITGPMRIWRSAKDLIFHHLSCNRRYGMGILCRFTPKL